MRSRATAVSPAELMEAAGEAWRLRSSRRPELPASEQFIGEVPARASQILRMTRRVDGNRAPIVRFRYFAVTPSGETVPLTFGMDLSATVLPHVAALVALALQADLDEHGAGSRTTQEGGHATD